MRPRRPATTASLFRTVRKLGTLALLLIVVISTGCVVPQPRGGGRMERLVEPTTRRGYYLYLPTDYVHGDASARSARRWPLVVSFHGMQPFDVASAQAREWQQEADRYGYIVIAPIQHAFSILGEFPLRSRNKAFLRDEETILAIVEHVFRTTHADRKNVLSTSWSSGGYMAHYMLNQHPDVFSCLAVRQSNFTARVLDDHKVAASRYHPVLILRTQNDFAICEKESQEAIEWYESNGYKNFAWVRIRRLGHERTPDVAADFFARAAGVTPSSSAAALARRQAIEGNATGLALLAGKMEPIQRPIGAATPASANGAPPATGLESRERSLPRITTRRQEPTPKPVTEQLSSSSPLAVSVSSTVGFEPLLLVYSAECPSDWYRRGSFTWTLNDEVIGHGVNGQRTVLHPGDYTLAVRVALPNGATYRAMRQVRVLKSIGARAGEPRP